MALTFASKLRESGLTTKDAATLGITYLKAHELIQLAPHYRESDGLFLPYFDSRGERLPDGFHRVRYFKDYSEQAKGRKYDGPADSFPHAYFPKNQRWDLIAEDVSARIVITEGELKAASACKFGIPTIGIGGVWSFRAKKHEIAFLPELEAFRWPGRKVELCFDSDIAAKPQVRLALIHLAKALTERGATVSEVQLAGGQTGATKVGLDDFLVEHGAAAFEALDRTQPDPIASRFASYFENWIFVQQEQHIVDIGSPFVRGIRPIVFDTVAKFDSAMKPIHYVYLDGDKARKIYASKWWIEYPHRKDVPTYTLDPSTPELVTEEGLNLFRGLGVEPRRGTVEPMLRLLDVLCSGRRELRRWMTQWLAYPLQRPGTKLHQCVFVASPHQGIGKTALGEVMIDIYSGPPPTLERPNPNRALGTGHGVVVSDEEIFGPWNEWLEYALFAIGDDLAFAGDKKSKGEFKRLITSESAHLSAKYRARRQVANKCNLYMTANSLGSLPLEESSNRRVCVVGVEKTPDGWRDYLRKEWHTWRHTGGPAHWLDYLLRFDIADFNPRGDAFATDEKETAKSVSESQVTGWLNDTWPTLVERSELWRLSVLVDLYRARTNDTRTTGAAIGRALLARGATKFRPLLIHGRTVANLWVLDHTDRWLRRKPKALAAYYEERFDGFDAPKA